MPTDLRRLTVSKGVDGPRLRYRFIERFEITPTTGPTLYGTLWATPIRTSGRRIQVHDADGEELFDTDDAYDLGNAINALDCWLAERYNLKTADVPK